MTRSTARRKSSERSTRPSRCPRCQSLDVNFQELDRPIAYMSAFLRVPMPVQRPIPIWLGGSADATLRRIAAMGDGWFPQMPPNETAREAVEHLRTYARDAGRDPSSIGIEARVSIAGTTPDDWVQAVDAWKGLGATHLAVNTTQAGLASPQEHIAAIRRFLEAVSSIQGRRL